MKINQLIILILILIVTVSINAQPTVGLLSYQNDKSFEGYNLIYPHDQPNIYLINNCGEIVHTWTDDNNFRPSETAYLQENGNIVKCKTPPLSINDIFFAGGAGAFIEIRTWDNELLWSFEQNNETLRLHHDIEILPNGHILAISWELKTKEETIQEGRDPNSIFSDELWPDYILEIDPETDSIIWEWHVWDHLIQDFDATKNNFGNIADHPELVDINWNFNNGREDWMHSNAIDYNDELDQILLTVANFSEVWVIDHSTTMEEASGHSGGMGNKGGDLLYRWGNPVAYQQGNESDQQLFYPHDGHWVGDNLDPSTSHFGKIAIFNNRANDNYSTANIWDAGFDTTLWSYSLSNGAWEPDEFDWTITHPEPTALKSRIASSVQILPNENILICSGRFGYVLELTPSNEVVWEYVIPFKMGNPVVQGTQLGANDNLTFRVKRYPVDYPAFAGRDLTPKGLIELQGDSTFCDQLLSIPDLAHPSSNFQVYPNPAKKHVMLENEAAQNMELTIYNLLGQPVHFLKLTSFQQIKLDISKWKSGIYLIINNGNTIPKKIIIP